MLSWLLFGSGFLIFSWWVVAGTFQKRIRLQRAARAVLKRDAALRATPAGLQDRTARAVEALAEAIHEYEAAHRLVIEPEPHYQILGGLQGTIKAFGNQWGPRHVIFGENIDRLRAWLHRQIPLWWLPMA